MRDRALALIQPVQVVVAEHGLRLDVDQQVQHPSSPDLVDHVADGHEDVAPRARSAASPSARRLREAALDVTDEDPSHVACPACIVAIGDPQAAVCLSPLRS